MPTMPFKAALVLGGARSGKSHRALELVPDARGGRRTFIATAEALDDEMGERIARHRAERGAGWDVVEEPIDVAGEVRRRAGGAILVDCLTLWLSNLMHRGLSVEPETERLLDSVRATTGTLVLVSNEVGLGLVPDTPLGRAFRDEQGRLNRRLAAACDRVELVVAGIPLTVKG